jgi:hypothetical protein
LKRAEHRSVIGLASRAHTGNAAPGAMRFPLRDDWVGWDSSA